MLNCTHLDEAAQDLGRVVTQSDWGFALACIGLFFLSALLLAVGERVVRPVGGLLVGCAAAGGVFVLSGISDPPLSCEVRLASAGGAAVVGATLAICLLRAGFALLGAAGFAAVAHVVYEAIVTTPSATTATQGNHTASDVELVDPSFFANRSGYYYLVMSLASLAGGAVAYVQRKQFVRISTSLVGAAGLVLLAHLVARRAGNANLPGVAALAILTLATIGGVTLQWRLGQAAKRKREEKRSPPLGVPVGMPTTQR